MELSFLGVRLEGWLTIVAIVLGPIFAVQAEKYLQRRRDDQQRKKKLFVDLMATRGSRLSQRHVDALNMIDLEFDVKKKREKPVVEAWRTYHDALNISGPEPYPGFYANRDGLFLTLLHEISKSLAFPFDLIAIKTGGYMPMGHGKLEEDLNAIRSGAKEVLAGRQPILIAAAPAAAPAPAPTPPNANNQ